MKKKISHSIINFALMVALFLGTSVFALVANVHGQVCPEYKNLNSFFDIDGNQFIPRGFVLNTEDLIGEINYTEDDYVRAARLGANYQVIRLDMALLGGWPGYKTDDDYLTKLDYLIGLGKKFGMRTSLKMPVYRIKGFKWQELWLNEKNEQEYLIKAWKQLWLRYKNEKSVFAYDLLNEPELGTLDVTYDELQKTYLLPLYRRMIDSLRLIDTEKWAMYQPILMENNPDRAKRPIPFWEMKVPIEREKVIYAPHIYQLDLSKIGSTFAQYCKDAALSNAPLFLGEWGSATYEETDKELAEQNKYRLAYARAAEIGDSLGIGMIKAWFLGSRWKGKNHLGMFTWAIFKDSIPVGTVERKYITDIIARPYPSLVAGKIEFFGFNHATREFTLGFKDCTSKGQTEIFVGANRHYPDGFTMTINDNWIAIYDPVKADKLQVLYADSNSKKNIVKWDSKFQKLTIKNISDTAKTTLVNILPGTLYQFKK